LVIAVTSNAMTLGWTAPGDDDYTGTAARYDLRFSTSPIAESDWPGATLITDLPAPAGAGTVQSMLVTGLSATTTYYFGLKATDKSNNVSLLSNIASGTTQSPTNAADMTPPAAITNLQVANITSNSATLSWTAPGDDGNTGTASGYDMRRSTTPITEANWSSATKVSGEPSPAAAGTIQSFTVNGLSAGVTYFFALKTSDESGNISPLSNVATGTMPPPPASDSNLVLIASNSVWKYLDNGTDQGTAWTLPNFDDSPWASGRAQLGYNNFDDVTVVSYGPDLNDKYITTYFRHHFSVADPSSLSTLTVNVRRDDGAVIYLNGTEVFRDNMTNGPINYLTRALTSVSGTNKASFHPSPPIAATLLLPGDNVVAAEIHQRSATSSQMSFNLELRAAVLAAPVVSIVRSDNQVLLKWNTQAGKHYRVESASDLFANSWTNLSADITATNSTASINDTMPAARRFYRVLVVD
jgi:hypothetical protein